MIANTVGLMARYRHFVPPRVTGGGRAQDRTARVFVWGLMDWVIGFTIAGWGATGVDITCKRECCGGRSPARFLDERLNADAHNRTVLAAPPRVLRGCSDDELDDLQAQMLELPTIDTSPHSRLPGC